MEPAAPVNICIKVHVREKTFLVKCGDGRQRIRWLANVGIVRYDDKTKGMDLGVPRGMQLEDGTRLSLDDIIHSKLTDGVDVWVLLREDGPDADKGIKATLGGQALVDAAGFDITLPVSPR
mmetsp:Transcript_6249/g.13746  ORF Transcript_6249/g.13746 Transcript_6249/m.13746 type:complete len:121 (-) Transcript_6249:64-426(-)|eukprot:CAMPEP_0178441546 /NCGR_PEP_ID=MMETSP0689_2-20121128/37534_1 /TAXON_ID=160604 /ORGANISM="Amphidinium massartii, Strain CS-259" /LENGTH=120 /DNA_ID=CAMNT_0020064723 /DNA_START=15 /DNA_END=377 /DNA_ORIENTATION=-